MSLWSRIVHVFRGDRLNRDIDEELQSHIQEAVDQGRDPREVRRAFGSPIRLREESRDLRLNGYLESLRSDTVFGWRQINKNRVTSAAAILSLALAIGACTSAFRLIDALLLRPLPVTNPERLYLLSREGIGHDGKPRTYDGCEYPLFRRMRAAVKDQAELLAISYAERTDLTYGQDREMERAYRQYVSGWMFSTFGLRPALGRLLSENDDLKPGGHPYAVLSHDYWSRRFGQDANVIGRTFRMGNHLYEIIGVAGVGFTGTEPGTVTDIFVPTMMNPSVDLPGNSWIRAFAKLNPGVAAEPVRDRLYAQFRAFRAERAKGFTAMPRQWVDNFNKERLLLKPSASGASAMQKNNRLPLAALGVLVALVLLIACANVANLMTAQAAARAREMALRVSIGAGRWRLLQLVLVESAMVACLAAVLGGVCAYWSAPFVVSMINPPNNPARLILPADGRVLAFGLALALGVTLLFGLGPAIRASCINPVIALKGGEDPHSRRRLMHALVAVQAAFCFLVLFVAGMFVATFQRLSNQTNGFSDERILTLDTVTKQAQPPFFWDQVAGHLRAVPGVEKVALAGWPLFSPNGWNDFISIGGAPPTEALTYFLSVSPGWTETMRIPLVDGRDFRDSDTHPGTAIVNEAFAKQYFRGENPIGRSFQKAPAHFQIVGLVRDARYRSPREPIWPTAYLPFKRLDAGGELTPVDRGTFIVRTFSGNPLAIAQTLRREVPQARAEFRVSNILTQTEINQSHTVRERLLAMLALFFAAVALLLAGVGLYGVLNYSVLQRRREIGIRMAIGAQANTIARLVIQDAFAMILVGAFAGVGFGLAAVRSIDTLFYEVKAGDLEMLAIPALAILVAASLAALPAILHAVRIDPGKMLRAD